MESAGSYLVVGWVANKREVNKKTQYLVRNPPPGARSQDPSSLPADPGLVIHQIFTARGGFTSHRGTPVSGGENLEAVIK